jgi:hypothetical protein
VKLVVLLVMAALLAVSCGSDGGKTYSLDQTRACLEDQKVRLGGQLDFVATTATGGALKANLGRNFVTIVFGETAADADNINQAYHRFSSSNVSAGIDDVLRQQDNAVMLWHEHPSDHDLALVTSCLK